MKINPTPASDLSIALVDDDRVLSSMLSEYLQLHGFNVDCYIDGEQALTNITDESQYQVIVLDIMMPKVNGLDVLQQLRRHIQTPVIMVTGRGDDIDKILGLEMGADDYLAKPCNPRELLARINVILRRNSRQALGTMNSILPPRQKTKIILGGIEVNTSTREAKIKGNVLKLTSVEFSILQHLMESAGTVVSKDDLSRNVLHRNLSAYDRSIDVHVSRIRKKIEILQRGSSAIKTLRGQGYLFTNDPE